ncbi:sigma-70 family RNA polymerase sigma factor [Vreelandella boliviensis]|uniref:Putative RNA polymerase sigma factor fecI n=1 Tax=Vreelandella boliviensis LC1 TaxID=1072583 RepID=A0A265E3A0_9GAMM|nr:sigma-70 family RNA polymerase sigma factor [Halomonas boliviensis]EHJ93414.1 putative RNA polymerase sigma factor fecI [Halomonas boliviensis LC1]OZT76051.1 RNA polymerase subunit sigma [Halomonas boliviensis LC1]
MVSIKQQARREAPFDALYHNHHSWLRRWLSAKLGCSHTAADLAHDTYLRILARGTTPAPDQSRRFLTQIAKGLMVDHYRRRRIETAYLETLSQLPETLSPSPEEQAITIEALVEIDVLLHGLSEKPRRAFLMCRLDGQSYQQIADTLGVSVSSVEKYIAKALLVCHHAMHEP